MRPIERIILRIRGLNPDEIERELEEMDEAKEERAASLKRAEEEARRRYVEVRMRGGGQ